MVGQEDQPLVVPGIVELHPAQVSRIVPLAFAACELDGLVAPQAGFLGDGARIDPPELQVRLGPDDEERLCLVQAMKPGKVDVAPVHDVEAPRLEGNLVEEVHVVEFAVRDVDEARDAAPQVEQGVQFDRAQGNSARHRSMVVESSA